MLLQRFKQFIEQHCIFSPASRILVGVSGGVDSITLLQLLRECGYAVGVAHCNFSLRGGESDGDEEFVRNICAENNIPFFTRRFNTEEYASAQGVSIQMSARVLRYEWFEQVMLENNFDKVAVAHNLNDNVETFFINLTRGTGLQGLSGMQPLQGKVARPLLFATRDEIIAYVELHKLSYREDSSNTSTKYARNYIRHRVVPEFTSINPSFLHSMQSNIERLSSTQAAVSSLVSDLKLRCCTKTNGTTSISIAAIPISQREFWLYELLQEYNFSGAVVKDIAQSLEGLSGKKFHSPTHTLIKDRDALIITKREDHVEPDIVEITQRNVENEVQIALSAHRQLRMQLVKGEVKTTPNKDEAFLDYDKLQFPLTLRHWQNGDSFIPFGMQGEKKLSDFFIDTKMSLFEKEQQLLLCSANKNIAWVIGQRIDNRYRITPNTKNVLKLELRNLNK